MSRPKRPHRGRPFTATIRMNAVTNSVTMEDHREAVVVDRTGFIREQHDVLREGVLSRWREADRSGIGRILTMYAAVSWPVPFDPY